MAVVGAGFMARGLVNQITNSTPGMTVAAVVNRTVAKAERAYAEAGVAGARLVTTPAEADAALEAPRALATAILDFVAGVPGRST